MERLTGILRNIAWALAFTAGAFIFVMAMALLSAILWS